MALQEALQNAQSAEQQGLHREAYVIYTRALELINVEIQEATDLEHKKHLIIQFKAAIERAETLKQQVEVEEYKQHKQHVQVLASQAVAADSKGDLATALQLYTQLLEVLNLCHRLETAPAAKQAILSKFSAYLQRAEAIKGKVDKQQQVQQQLLPQQEAGQTGPESLPTSPHKQQHQHPGQHHQEQPARPVCGEMHKHSGGSRDSGGGADYGDGGGASLAEQVLQHRNEAVNGWQMPQLRVKLRVVAEEVEGGVVQTAPDGGQQSSVSLELLHY